MNEDATHGDVGIIDRVGPTVHPQQRAVAFQRWRDLLFLHWRYDPDDVRQVLPRDVELDTFDGAAWVSLIPFAVEDSRPVVVPPGSGLNFLECNLRTYVHVDGKPGIWFFSLDASSRFAVGLARALTGLPYMYASMRTSREGRVVDYEVERQSMGHPKLRLRYEVGDPLPGVHAETLEFFLLERYVLFTRHLGALLQEQVHHAPYKPHDAYPVIREDALLGAAGLPRPKDPPIAHWQPSLDVEFFAPGRARAPANGEAKRSPILRPRNA